MRIDGYRKVASSRRIKAAVVALLFASSATLFAWADKRPSAPAPRAAAPARSAPAARPAASSARPTTSAARTTTSNVHPTTSSPHPTTTPGARTTTSSVHPGTTSPGGRTTTSTAHTTTSSPRPNTSTGVHPGGASTGRSTNTGNVHSAAGGRTLPGTRQVTTRSGAVAHVGPGGRVQSIQAHGMDIRRGPGGVHRVERVGPGGRVVVSNGAGHGYVQRPFRYGGREYVSRTYYVRGVPYVHAYRSYYFGGVAYGFYAPAAFYAPGFYGWAYTPWAVPVAYNFGWYGNPWFGYYGGWYTPYPVYATPALWLTDYYMGATLRAAYEERVAEAAAANAAANAPAPAPQPSQVALSPEVKQLIAEEVQRQLQAAKAEAANVAPASAPVEATPAMFADNTPHIFVVSTGLDVTSQGQQCPVTEGDVLQTRGALPTNSPTADAVVLASKGQDCAKGSVVQVAVQDLVEMQNHMRETIDQGLGDLRSQQGKKGLPTIPASYATTPTQARYVSAEPPAEQNIAEELSKQAREANQAEQEVVTQALSPAGSAPAPAQANPATISMGQSIQDVVASLGQPKQAIDVGPKKIYVYKDLKITFLNGKVSDVQ